MEVSDVNLGDWDIVGSSLEESEDEKNVKEDAPESPQEDEMESDEEEKEDISEDNMDNAGSQNKEETVNGSGIEEIEPEYHPHYESSCSSGSDVDVIDEGPLEDLHSNMSLNPCLDISICSDLDSPIKHRPLVATTPEVGSYPPLPPPRNETPNLPTCPRIQGLFYLFMIAAVVVLVYLGKPKNLQTAFTEMENRIIQLEAENKELKDHMLTKVDDDKLLTTMETQISALKDENYKLSVFMQDLINELEHQTIVFKKDSESKSEKSQQNEIDKLKEQVNILRIDNDELQKQLVRMRYGVYSHRPTSAKSSDKGEEDETNAKINEQENATEILSEEIKELKEKLLSEVAKLNEWKKSVHVLMKGLENPPRESSDAKSSKPKGQKNKKDNRYERILKDINDQFAEAVNNIPKFNLTDLVQKYMGVDKKKVKSVFDSVGHFFKKAQEKTKDIFDENIKSDMWNFIGSFRKQWHVLRKSYFEYSKKLQQGYNQAKEHTAQFYEKHTKDTYHDTERKDRKYGKVPTEEMSNKVTDIPTSDDQQDSTYEPQNEQEVQKDRRGEETISRNSWVFERAAHRSHSRETPKEEEEVNWFLKNKKRTETPDYFRMDENDQESDSYEPNNMFSMN